MSAENGSSRDFELDLADTIAHGNEADFSLDDLDEDQVIFVWRLRLDSLSYVTKKELLKAIEIAEDNPKNRAFIQKPETTLAFELTLKGEGRIGLKVQDIFYDSNVSARLGWIH